MLGTHLFSHDQISVLVGRHITGHDQISVEVEVPLFEVIHLSLFREIIVIIRSKIRWIFLFLIWFEDERTGSIGETKLRQNWLSSKTVKAELKMAEPKEAKSKK